MDEHDAPVDARNAHAALAIALDGDGMLLIFGKLHRFLLSEKVLRAFIARSTFYVRTAIARGNDRHQVLWGHVLKNSLVPTVTFLGQTMAEIVAGSIVVEQVFSIPGLGRMLVASISNQDYPVLEAIVVIPAFWVVLSGTLADLINRCIDPRMGGAAE